jgi:hypothetical protein
VRIATRINLMTQRQEKMTDKASSQSSLDQHEKANTDGGAAVSYAKQLQALSKLKNDKSLAAKDMWDAIGAMNTPRWIETHKPPLFLAPLSRDPPEVRAAAMEAALKEPGADPNELDHDLLDRMTHAGRVLHCCVCDEPYEDYNRGHEKEPYYGFWYNLPVIEVLLRHGADPRLYGHTMLRPPGPPIRIVTYRRDNPYPDQRPEETEFFIKAADMMEAAVKVLEGQ